MTAGSHRQFDLVRAHAGSGASHAQIAATTGVPRSTVQRWLNRERAPRETAANLAAAWAPTPPHAYAYLLGMYLGDGHLDHPRRNTWTLKVSCDPQYPGIIDELAAAISDVFDGRRSTRRLLPDASCLIIAVTHPAIGRAFPQHGAGRKHDRPIVLADWQLAITRAHPEHLLRGLIHSDGCRCTNRFSTRLPSGRVAEYAYVRYFFSNLSADIRAIFRSHAEMLGIVVTQPNARNLAVSRRRSVARLDEFVGPKS